MPPEEQVEQQPEAPKGPVEAVSGYVTDTVDSWLETRKHSNRLIIAALILVSLPIIGAGVFLTRSVVPYDRIVRTIPLQNLVRGKSAASATAFFICAQGKSITATFEDNAVRLVLSDGRTLTLQRTISASGARYANSDESFVFWNKGTTAFIDEGAVETYTACVTNN